VGASPSSAALPAHRQQAYALRHDWGLQGAAAITARVDIAVVVDVLSFTTTLSVAAEAGIVVLPYRWADDGAEALAGEHDAVLAVGRTAGPDRISLSPLSVRAADPPPARLVLPSPNGSTIAHGLAGAGPVVIGACLRNAAAVARWITGRHRPGTATIAVISAGERWPDGSLRPCVEDLCGAGALLDALGSRGWGGLSPESQVARNAYRSARGDLPGVLHECASGRELVMNGFAGDVDIASELDSSRAVPLLVDGAFRPRVAD
jgi:2-phosphosulfolactate phosphatase